MSVDGEPLAWLTMLGTGTSMGVPMIGCTCEVCTSGHPRNQRTRTGVHALPPGVFTRLSWLEVLRT